MYWESGGSSPAAYEVVFGYNCCRNVVSWRNRLGKAWQYSTG